MRLLRILSYNVSSLLLTAGDVVQQPITLVNGEALVDISIEDKSIITFEIVRQTASSPAFISVKYQA